MELRSMRHVVALAHHLSFTRAAEALGLTQSALSRSLQQIEDASKVRLFDRERGGSVRLTALGRTFTSRMQELLRRADEMDQFIKHAAAGKQQRVSFGMGRQPASALLSTILSDEQREHPELQIRVFVRRPDALLELMKKGDIEFFVTLATTLITDESVDVVRIGKVKLGCLVRPGHPLLSDGSHGKREDYPWIVSTNLHGDQLVYGLGYGLQPEPQIMLEDMGCAARVTEQTDLIWLTSTFAAIREVQEGRLKELPLGGAEGNQASFEVHLYKLSGASLSPAALRLMARVCDAGSVKSALPN